VIVHNLHIVCVAIVPGKADAVLAVNTNAVLAFGFPVPGEGS